MARRSILLGTALFAGLTLPTAEGHRDGCHRWHSCPSDHNTYVCGDLGKCHYCPDNRYCKDRQPREPEDKGGKGDK